MGARRNSTETQQRATPQDLDQIGKSSVKAFFESPWLLRYLKKDNK